MRSTLDIAAVDRARKRERLLRAHLKEIHAAADLALDKDADPVTKDDQLEHIRSLAQQGLELR